MNFSFFFTVFLKNRNISSKIIRSNVTDYAALKHQIVFKIQDKTTKTFIQFKSMGYFEVAQGQLNN